MTQALPFWIQPWMPRCTKLGRHHAACPSVVFTATNVCCRRWSHSLPHCFSYVSCVSWISACMLLMPQIHHLAQILSSLPCWCLQMYFIFLFFRNCFCSGLLRDRPHRRAYLMDESTWELDSHQLIIVALSLICVFGMFYETSFNLESLFFSF